MIVTDVYYSNFFIVNLFVWVLLSYRVCVRIDLIKECIFKKNIYPFIDKIKIFNYEINTNS